jgi:DeoR/GlpR family transcriptional regulator of sugar metabolism
MTIRRDLHALEDASEVRMFHGGAGLAPSAARITHSIPVLQLLDERTTAARMVALGGELLADRHAFVGPTTEAVVAGLRARTFFLAPAAIDAGGMYAQTAAEASLQRRLQGSRGVAAA